MRSITEKSGIKAMTLLFSGGLLLPFHDHLRVIRDLDEHLADRLEQRQPVSPELVLISRTTSFSAAGAPSA